MPEFVEQHVFLVQQVILIALQTALNRNILDAKQDIGVRFLVVNDAGIQQHHPSSNAGEVMLNFVFTHRALTGYNFFQQQAELWNVPLVVTQFIKALSSSVVGIS
jgi:hypothetical protein